MSYKVSIIIPIYNAEKTIERTINSVINQTMSFEDIELILIDDCSTDNTKSILEEYGHVYNNIKLIYLKENTGGPAKPRNIGLKNVTSDYVIFMDNDDIILEDYCETLYNTITEENCDIVNCSEASQFLDGIYGYHEMSYEKTIVDEPLYLRLTAWGNIFKYEFLIKNNIKFPKYADDANFALVAYTKANKVIQLEKYSGYVFTVETEEMASLSHTAKKESFPRSIKGYQMMQEYLEENNLEKEYILNEKVYFLYLSLFKFKGSRNEKIEIFKLIAEFEKNLGFEAKMPSKPVDILNKFVLKKKYNISLFMTAIATFLYNNRTIKNFIMTRWLGVKKIEI